LVGTWSIDCALRLKEEDVFVKLNPENLSMQKIPFRKTFTTPWFGSPMVISEMAFKREPTANQQKIDFTLINQQQQIQAATRATDEKIGNYALYVPMGHI